MRVIIVLIIILSLKICTNIHPSIHVSTHPPTYISIHPPTHIYIHTYIHPHISTHIHTYLPTYIHTSHLDLGYFLESHVQWNNKQSRAALALDSEEAPVLSIAGLQVTSTAATGR